VINGLAVGGKRSGATTRFAFGHFGAPALGPHRRRPSPAWSPRCSCSAAYCRRDPHAIAALGAIVSRVGGGGMDWLRFAACAADRPADHRYDHCRGRDVQRRGLSSWAASARSSSPRTRSRCSSPPSRFQVPVRRRAGCHDPRRPRPMARRTYAAIARAGAGRRRRSAVGFMVGHGHR